MDHQNKKALVTGGAGFIGSHLVESLVKRGYQVTIIDDLSSGKIARLEALIQNDAVQFFQGSVADLALLQKICQGVQYVFHEAAVVSVVGSLAAPMKSHHTNLTGTLNVLLAARDNGVQKVILASSSAVYGANPALPQHENQLPDPLSPYAVTKLAAEYYCRVFQQVYELPTVCLRYFNVYGPRQDPGSEYAAVIPKFIQRALAGQPLIIYGDGEQSRDFVFVGDVVEANILAAESKASGIYNIGAAKAITINRLAELVIQAFGAKVKIVHDEARPGEAKHSLADISLARDFGYLPRCELEDGLGKVISSHPSIR
jgi:UDP-glucose 4-epimerase